ncbi:MAG: SH3 domain-containing protein [Vicinamibacterales bacterium]
MFRTSFRGAVICAASIALTASTVSAQLGGITKEKQGKGGSVVKGAAGTDGGIGDDGLEHCGKPMGAMAVVEPQSEYMMALGRYNLSSPVSLIRMMIQQSNCFIVVERGQGLRNMQQERDLAGGGQMRSGANIGGGQMVPADFIMTPAVVFSEGNAGGIGGALGAFGGRKAGIIGGGLKFKEAQTSMLVTDARSGVQVAAAEGSTKKADMKLGGGLFGGGGGVAAGGYGNTNEGKIIAAAFMDNYNKVVGVVRDDPSLQRNVGTLKEEAAGGGTRKAGAVFNEGDVVGPKIAGIKVYAQPDDTSKVVATLARGDELLVDGDEKNGFIKVQGASASGWVKTTMVSKR